MTKLHVLPLSMSVLLGACFNPPSSDPPMPSTSGSTGDTMPDATGPDPDTGTTGDPETTTGIDPTTGPGDESTSTGSEVEPDIQVSVDGMEILPGESIPLPGTADVGVVGGTVTVTVENVGGGTLLLAGVLPSGGDTGDFQIDQAGLASSLAEGESSTFAVSLDAESGGAKAMTVSLGSTDPDEDPYELTFLGHTTPNVFRNLMPPSAPSPRFNSGMTGIPDDRMVLFGGRDNTGTRLNDTWIYDVVANTWTPMMPPGAVPAARDALQLVYVGGNAVMMYGGNTATGSDPMPQNDTWIYDFAANSWSQVITPSPPARFQHMMVSLGTTALMFGGRTGFSGTDVNDTWRFNAATQTWMNMNPAGAPSARSVSAMAFDGVDTVTLYGGFQATTPVNTSFNYTVSTNSWAPAGQVGFNPGNRAVLEGEYLDAGRMVVYSGKLNSCCQDPAPGTFAYDPMTNMWADLSALAEPPPRYNYGMGAVPGRNKAIIFGGQLLNGGPGSAQNTTFELVGPLPTP